MDKLTSMTDEAIAELERDPRVLSLRLAIEAQFDKWTQVLFPLLKLKQMSCYIYVADMLVKAGHEAATKELVGVYMRRIAKHRNVKSVVRVKPVQAHQGVTPSVTLTPMAREIQSASVTRLVPSVRAVDPVAQAVSPPPMAVPGIEPVEVTNWRAEIIRLESEKSSAPWTGADQWMWNYFEAVARSIGRTLPKDFMSVEKSVDDPIKVDCLDKLLAKRM